jgi:hypothetical protein
MLAIGKFTNAEMDGYVPRVEAEAPLNQTFLRGREKRGSGDIYEGEFGNFFRKGI